MGIDAGSEIDPENTLKVETRVRTPLGLPRDTTGYLNDLDVIPGLGRDGNAYTITTLEGAVDAAEEWARFVNERGPIVVGATQGLRSAS